MRHYPNVLSRSSCLVFLALALIALLSGSAVAGDVASGYELGDSGWSAVVNPDWDISFAVDGLSDDAVIIQIQKRFTGELDEFGLLPAMYLEFVKDSEEAVPQIIITDEYIVNDTAADWLDFHMELIGSPLAGFDPQYIPSGDQFATVVLSGSNGYDGLPTKFDFYDGLVVNEPPGDDTFRPGYDSGAMAIITNPDMQVGQGILLKEYPTVPEPATLMVLLISGGLALLGHRRRR
ncbi:MAG: PEP-CTERM sorting domain-containing protein [Actinobacteria bacterium]|nr:PEP-CTERM sorting domain-containing protein [Actinomycetota bacterium]